jgi:hypothetical protein
MTLPDNSLNSNDYHHRYSARVDANQMSGYLCKKSSGGDWQRRYFETSGGYLTYYKNHKMSKLLAAIAIPQVGSIHLVGPEADSKGAGMVFQVDLKDRQYFLRAVNEKEAQMWIDFLTNLRDGHLPQRSTNPLNPDHSHDAKKKRPSMQVDYFPLATVNKSTRVHVCCYRR